MPKDSPHPPSDLEHQQQQHEDDDEEWEDEEDMIDIDDILDLAGQTNALFYALMVSPEFNAPDPATSAKPLLFVADFVRRTYLDYILKLLPTDAPYKAREIANSFLFEYTAEKPIPTEPNPGYLDDEANWPDVDNDVYTDAVGRNIMICMAILEAHEPGSKGALMLSGQYDFDVHVKEVATMIVGGREVQEEIMRSHGIDT